jgi:hypothetical protein
MLVLTATAAARGQTSNVKRSTSNFKIGHYQLSTAGLHKRRAGGGATAARIANLEHAALPLSLRPENQTDQEAAGGTVLVCGSRSLRTIPPPSPILPREVENLAYFGAPPLVRLFLEDGIDSTHFFRTLF